MNNFNKFIKNYSIIIALFSFPNLIYGMEQAQEKDQFNNEIFSPMDKEAYNLILAINDESDIEKLDTSRDVKEALYSFYGEIDEINKADGFFFKNALLSILQRYKRKPNKAIRNKHRKEALVNSLITSCDQGYMNIAKFILFLGADVNRIDNCNGSALMYAAAAGKTQAVKLLLRAGADTNLKNVYQSSALSYAIEKNHFEVVELLIQNGAHVNDPVRKIYHPYYAPPPAISPLRLAVCQNEPNLDTIELLLKHGADINDKIFEEVEKKQSCSELKKILHAHESVRERALNPDLMLLIKAINKAENEKNFYLLDHMIGGSLASYLDFLIKEFQYSLVNEVLDLCDESRLFELLKNNRNIVGYCLSVFVKKCCKYFNDREFEKYKQSLEFLTKVLNTYSAKPKLRDLSMAINYRAVHLVRLLVSFIASEDTLDEGLFYALKKQGSIKNKIRKRIAQCKLGTAEVKVLYKKSLNWY